VALTLGIFAYIAITSLFIRFIQVTRNRDDDMRRISAEWIEQTSGGVVSG
jgi:hypothetical protein